MLSHELEVRFNLIRPTTHETSESPPSSLPEVKQGWHAILSLNRNTRKKRISITWQVLIRFLATSDGHMGGWHEIIFVDTCFVDKTGVIVRAEVAE